MKLGHQKYRFGIHHWYREGSDHALLLDAEIGVQSVFLGGRKVVVAGDLKVRPPFMTFRDEDAFVVAVVRILEKLERVFSRGFVL